MAKIHKVEVFPDADGRFVTVFEGGLEILVCPADCYHFWLERHFGSDEFFTNYHEV